LLNDIFLTPFLMLLVPRLCVELASLYKNGCWSLKRPKSHLDSRKCDLLGISAEELGPQPISVKEEHNTK